LCCSTYWKQVPAVLDAVREGVISEERINESVLRVLKLKAEFGII
jgi:beta-N-acetylhexosaminidase